jgi:lactate dehydrogenase-like 2-hydroxyacid dehydrogenase
LKKKISYSPNSIAEFTVGLGINLARRLRMAFERTKLGDFKLTPKLLGFESKHIKIIFLIDFLYLV